MSRSHPASRPVTSDAASGMRIEHGLLPGQVLQRLPRGARAVVTGSCTVAGVVTVTVRGAGRGLPRGRRVGSARGGRFRAVVAGLPAGGPYIVELACGNERATVAEVFVGDLWLMAGQSNMEGVGNLSGAPEPHPMVRCLGMDRVWRLARDPLHQLYASPDAVHWTNSDPALAKGRPLDATEAAAEARRQAKGVGVGVTFGSLMHARSGVPQGLIACAHGGTSMAQWDPERADRGGASLYGSMLLSLHAVGQPVAGVLWYQGCSDASAADLPLYTRRMQGLVAAVRRDLRQPRLPWVTVQIASVINGNLDVASWNGIQELQRRLPAVIPRLETVPAIDLPLDDGIHIGSPGLAVLAGRMARQAARLVHGDHREAPPIAPRRARLIEGEGEWNIAVEVEFDHVVGGLASDGPARGFTLHDPAGRPQALIFRSELDGSRARLLISGRLVGPLTVSYGHGADPACTVHDGRGMGMPVFTGLPVEPIPGLGPWFLRWRVGPLAAGEDIAVLPRPASTSRGLLLRDYEPPFANQRPEWKDRSGHQAFHGEVTVPRAGVYEMRVGYDGPIRMWIGDQEVHTDLQGSNPALPDDKRVRVRLQRGRQPITVLMALNRGRAWGFYLRFRTPGAGPQPVPWGG